MGKFIRKLKNQAIWKKLGLPPEKDNILEFIPSDVFSECMESKQNKLSIWKVEGDDWDDYSDVIATIVCGADGPSKTDLVILEEETLTGIEKDKISGTTPACQQMNDMHYDVVNLTHFKVGQIANFIGLQLVKEQAWEDAKQPKPNGRKFRRFSEKEMVGIMSKALEKGIIKKEDLSARWQKKL